MKIINFYGRENEYGWLSNFSHHSITLEGKIWPTSEHFYQAMKFDDKEYQNEIKLAFNPEKAKRLGNEKHSSFKSNWKEIMDDTMRKAVYAKFTQHLDLKKNLINTEDAVLVEHTENDKYWGDGGDGSGKNMLGKILMETRNRIKMETIFY